MPVSFHYFVYCNHTRLPYCLFSFSINLVSFLHSFFPLQHARKQKFPKGKNEMSQWIIRPKDRQIQFTFIYKQGKAGKPTSWTKILAILVSLTDYPNSCCWCRSMIITIIRLWFVKYVDSSQQWLFSEHDSNCLLCSVALCVYYTICNVCALHYIGGDCRAPLGPWRHIKVAAAR